MTGALQNSYRWKLSILEQKPISTGGYYSDSHSLEQRQRWYDPVAHDYDLARPRYHDAVLDRAIALAALEPEHCLLEIGCGPGIATLPLAQRGFEIKAIEPSGAACAIARAHCTDYPKVEIVQSTFEAWPGEMQLFDAAVAATSFHWISQDIGYPKLRDSLKSRGRVILLWNVPPQPSEAIWRSLQPIYQHYAPELSAYTDRAEQEQQLKAMGHRLVKAEPFISLGFEKIDCSLTYTVKDYLALLSSLSPYILLEAAQREKLMTALARKLHSLCGDAVQTSYFSAFEVLQKTI